MSSPRHHETFKIEAVKQVIVVEHGCAPDVLSIRGKLVDLRGA